MTRPGSCWLGLWALVLAIASPSCVGLIVPRSIAAGLRRPFLMTAVHEESSDGKNRRSFLAGTAAIGASIVAPGPSRATEDFTLYSDVKLGVKFEVPASWQKSEQEISGGRRLVIWVDPKDPDTNCFVAYTPVRGDYMSLGSFGPVDAVAMTVVPKAPNLKSKLLEAKQLKGNYFFDYTVQSEDQVARHLNTIFAVVPGEMLVTFTSQTTEERFSDLKPTISKGVDSFAIGGK